MMTDTKTLPPDTDKQPPQPKTKRLDMSGTQLVGGAFAAMTAAVIGAQLGVAGTVLGARPSAAWWPGPPARSTPPR